MRAGGVREADGEIERLAETDRYKKRSFCFLTSLAF